MIDIIWWALVWINVNLGLTALCPFSEPALRRALERNPNPVLTRRRMVLYSATFGGLLTLGAWTLALLQRQR